MPSVQHLFIFYPFNNLGHVLPCNSNVFTTCGLKFLQIVLILHFIYNAELWSFLCYFCQLVCSSNRICSSFIFKRTWSNVINVTYYYHIVGLIIECECVTWDAWPKWTPNHFWMISLIFSLLYFGEIDHIIAEFFKTKSIYQCFIVETSPVLKICYWAQPTRAKTSYLVNVIKMSLTNNRGTDYV